MHGTTEHFKTLGYTTVPAVLNSNTCAALARRIRTTSLSGGSRNLLSKTWCQALVERLRQHAELAALIPRDHVAIQCTYFEKSALRNWGVAAHQDLSVPVSKRVDSTELHGWAQKEGALFVQAPTALLEQLIAVRLHLEACDIEDGPLKLIPSSHRLGRLNNQAVRTARQASTEVICTAALGEALVMRPLLIHSSSKTTGSSRRRVLHFVFAPRDPGYGLQWAHRA